MLRPFVLALAVYSTNGKYHESLRLFLSSIEMGLKEWGMNHLERSMSYNLEIDLAVEGTASLAQLYSVIELNVKTKSCYTPNPLYFQHRRYRDPLKRFSRGRTGAVITALDGVLDQGDSCFTEVIESLSVQPEVARLILSLGTIPLGRAGGKGGLPRRDETILFGLDGTGEILGIADTGLDDGSCYFRGTNSSTRRDCRADFSQRKVIQYCSYADEVDDLGGHGTFVTAAAVGKCVEEENDAYKLMDGIASGARVAFFDIGRSSRPVGIMLPPVEQMLDTNSQTGARIHSNSWGQPNYGMASAYSYLSLEVDAWLYSHPESLVVFAVGNEGYYGRETILSPADAKNALTVGALVSHDPISDERDSSVAPYSSIGPTSDGRHKPDLVAPGDIQSAFAASTQEQLGRLEGRGVETGYTCALHSLQGSSMAAPHVAALGLLLNEYFKNASLWATTCRRYSSAHRTCVNGAFAPSGVLLKSLLLHSARPVASYSLPSYNAYTKVPSFPLRDPEEDLMGVPDDYQGYGEPLLAAVLPQITKDSNGLWVWDSLILSPGDTLAVEVVLISNGSSSVDPSTPPSLRVTLGWYDPPRSHFASNQSQLVHDLDLAVIVPNRSLLFGNRATHASTPRPTAADWDRHTDTLNTVEMVNLPRPSGHCFFSSDTELCAFTVLVHAKRSIDMDVDKDKNDSMRCSLVITADHRGKVGEPHRGVVWGQALPHAPTPRQPSFNDTARDTTSPTPPKDQGPPQQKADVEPTSRGFMRKIPFASVRLAAEDNRDDTHTRVPLSTFQEEGAVLLAVSLQCSSTHALRQSHPGRARHAQLLSQPINGSSPAASDVGDWTQGAHCLLLAVILTDPCGHTHTPTPTNATPVTSLTPTLLLGGFEYFHAIDGEANHFMQRTWPDLWANEIVRTDSGGFRARRDVAFMGLGAGCPEVHRRDKAWHVELALGYDKSAYVGAVEYSGEILLHFQRVDNELPTDKSKIASDSSHDNDGKDGPRFLEVSIAESLVVIGGACVCIATFLTLAYLMMQWSQRGEGFSIPMTDRRGAYGSLDNSEGHDANAAPGGCVVVTPQVDERVQPYSHESCRRVNNQTYEEEPSSSDSDVRECSSASYGYVTPDSECEL